MTTPAKIIDTGLPSVVLVGRVNVGKSTLFNKIAGKNHALVSDIPGTTRTRNIATVSWRGKNFKLVDTGGLTFSSNIPMENDVIKQTEIGISESDLILFVVDLQTDLLPQERELAKKLADKKTRTILVGNKADNERIGWAAYRPEWKKLGLGEPAPVSAINGVGVGDLLDIVYKKLGKISKRPKQLKEKNPIKVALIGKPNVGKSSLFNSLVGKEQVIVNEMPHTTREPHDTLVEAKIEKKSYDILFVDTAGIRKKTKVAGELEKQGIQKSILMIEKADIVLLLLDAGEPITDQDKQLGGLLKEHSKSVIIIVNKWDSAEANDDAFRNQVKERVYADFPHLDFAPIIFVSAKTQYRTHQIFPLIAQAWEARHTEIPQTSLNDFMQKTTREHRPSRGKGTRHPQIIGFRQVHNNPPIFEMSIKAKTSIHFSYVRFIENRLRRAYGFFAAPIVIKLRKSKKI